MKYQKVLLREKSDFMKIKIILRVFCLMVLPIIMPSMITVTGTASTDTTTKYSSSSDPSTTNTSSQITNLPDNVTGVFHGTYISMSPTNPALEMHVLMTLKYRNYDHLLQFLTDVQTIGSPIYHHFLTQSDFIAQYSPDPALYAGLVTYFQQHGFTVQTYTDRVTLGLRGTLDQFEQVFHTHIRTITTTNATFYAPVQSLSLDYNIGNNIQAIVGLNNESNAHISPLFTTFGDGTQQLYGADLQNAYQENQLYTQKGYPTTQTIAIILWTGHDSNNDAVAPYDPSDITYYFQHNLPSSEPQPNVCANPIHNAPPPGSSAHTDVTGVNLEATLDIEMAGSTAPGANIVFVYGLSNGTTDIIDAFNTILNPVNANCRDFLTSTTVISNSFGTDYPTGDQTTPWDSDSSQAAARGITVLAASGDNGNSEEPSFPAEDVAKYIYDSYGSIAVGGTETTLTGSDSLDGTGTTGIASQNVWYNTPYAGNGSQGGISLYYNEPSFQSNSMDANIAITNANNNVYGGHRSGQRATPDIAGIGALMRIYITLYNGSSMYIPMYGTSVASPLVAGVVASMNNYIGEPEGFFSPTIYQLGQEQYAGGFSLRPPFFDIITGANGHFPAQQGYDLATGWGSINAYNFILDQEFLNHGGGSAFESFESSTTDKAIMDGWAFANPSRWGTSQGDGHDGSYSLKEKNNAGSSGLIYDTVQNQMFTITDGSIEGWIYVSGSNYKMPSIWIRTGLQTTNGGSCGTVLGDSTSICTGYLLRFYNTYAVLIKAGNGGTTISSNYNIPQGISGTWWHVKLQTIGSTINAWITVATTFDDNNPTLTATDGIYTSGYVAFSGRTNFVSGSYYEYYDSIGIMNLAKSTESFELGLTGAMLDGWVFDNNGRWIDSTDYAIDGSYSLKEKNNAGSSGLMYDTVQNQMFTITDGSIEGWIYVYGSNFKMPSIWIRTGPQTTNGGSCGTVLGDSASICTGYLLRFYNNYAVIVNAGNGGTTISSNYNIPHGISGTWWHVKLQAIGSTISAWITDSTTFSTNPTLTATDGTYTSGYVAFSGRTNFISGIYFEYYDAFKVYWSS